MQKEILQKNPSLAIRVYSIWFSMLPGDTPATFLSAQKTLPDSRVMHFWDGQRIAGRWFKDNVSPEYPGKIMWDAYYLYGPQCEWKDIPEPPLIWGRTIMEKREVLMKEISLLPNAASFSFSAHGETIYALSGFDDPDRKNFRTKTSWYNF